MTQTAGNKLAQGLIKNGIGALVNYNLFQVGRAMNRERKGSTEAIRKMQQDIEPGIVKPIPTQYEFVFYEKMVVSVKNTLASLMETVVLSGATVEPEVIAEATKLIRMMDNQLRIKEEKSNGNQA